jgi:quinol monooxygenase YgiN
MYVRITQLRIRPGRWTDFEASLVKVSLTGRDVALGHLETWCVRSLEDEDSGFVFTVWETEEAMKAYEQTEHFADAGRSLDQFLVGEAPFTRGEVRFIRGLKKLKLRKSRW